MSVCAWCLTRRGCCKRETAREIMRARGWCHCRPTFSARVLGRLGIVDLTPDATVHARSGATDTALRAPDGSEA